MKHTFAYSIGSSAQTMQIKAVKIVINPEQQENAHSVVSVQVSTPIGYILTSEDYRRIQAYVYRQLDR